MTNKTNFITILIPLLFLPLLLFSQNQSNQIRVGETLYYDVTFGRFLKGKSIIKFHGKTTYDSKELFYITYDTKFVGNIYNLHADIYANDEFFPVCIKTKIRRPGKLSEGLELFYHDRKMAIFSQIIEGKEEVDTIFRKYPIQDITTLPFYLSRINFVLGDSLKISLPQSELKLRCEKIEEIEVDEENNYSTFLIKSEPKGFKMWLNRGKNRVPIKVYIEQSKIKMLLRKIEIDKSILEKHLDEKETKEETIEEINGEEEKENKEFGSGNEEEQN